MLGRLSATNCNCMQASETPGSGCFSLWHSMQAMLHAKGVVYMHALCAVLWRVTPYRSLMTCLCFAGTVAAEMSAERRHGPGQKKANIIFREWLTKQVTIHKDLALKGMENFCKIPARQAVRNTRAHLWYM